MNVMKTTLSVLIACFMLASPCAVSAEETVEKNFEYYLTLSDYEVYLDYCNTYGFVAEDTLPETEELPHYSANFKSGFYVVDITDSGLTQSDAYQFSSMPELFGMPDEWYEEEIVVTEYQESDYEWVTEGIPERYCVDVPTIVEGPVHTTAHVKYELSYFYGSFDLSNIINKYRMRLTLENSEFVKQYAQPTTEYSGMQIFTSIVYDEILPDTPSIDPIFGDINADNIVDATDAALLLEYAAAVGAGNADTLEAYLASKSN